jgi:hypothetical protein
MIGTFAPASVDRAALAGIAAVSAALLMTELALTRIFSVTMYYHFAFLAISIALFGLSASSVFVYVMRSRLEGADTRELLAAAALFHAIATVIALWCLVRIRVGLNYTPANLARMLAIYSVAALPFLTGGAVIALAFTRLSGRINVVYAADLLGAAAGCLILIPLVNWLGAPGVVLIAAGLSACAAVLFTPGPSRRRVATIATVLFAIPTGAHAIGLGPFDVSDTKGHEGDTILFSKWNSFSRVAVYDRPHGDWSLSPTFTGRRGESLFMDIDSAASTPILRGTGNLADDAYLKYELTALAYHLVERPDGFTALVIGPGGGRDLVSALLFGARQVEGVEINPIIARDVMLDRFRQYSGGIYEHPRVRVHVDDGRSFVRRSVDQYDVIQASLVDTWAATAAGAYTLTENSLYTSEAFGEYLDHLTDTGYLTVTRWVFDGLRLVSLAQEACESRGLDARRHLAIVRHGRVATFLLKKSPFTSSDVAHLERLTRQLGFSVLYAPGLQPPLAIEEPVEMQLTGTSAADYRRLIVAPDRHAFYASYPLDISPTTDDRPFFFHTTRLKDQFQVAFGRSMLFGNGLSALLTLMGISGALVMVFIVGPLAADGGRPAGRWGGWLGYFAALGAGFMLIEVSLLQQFVLLLGHPVYSLTVTLFALLLGTGLGSLFSRRVPAERVRRTGVAVIACIVAAAIGAIAVVPAAIDAAIAWPLAARLALAVALLIPVGVLLGVPLPSGMRILSASRPALIPWGWGLNGAFSVVGATLAIFIAMNWGFSTTLLAGSGIYALAAALFAYTTR